MHKRRWKNYQIRFYLHITKSILEQHTLKGKCYCDIRRTKRIGQIFNSMDGIIWHGRTMYEGTETSNNSHEESFCQIQQGTRRDWEGKLSHSVASLHLVHWCRPDTFVLWGQVKVDERPGEWQEGQVGVPATLLGDLEDAANVRIFIPSMFEWCQIQGMLQARVTTWFWVRYRCTFRGPQQELCVLFATSTLMFWCQK